MQIFFLSNSNTLIVNIFWNCYENLSHPIITCFFATLVLGYFIHVVVYNKAKATLQLYKYFFK